MITDKQTAWLDVAEINQEPDHTPPKYFFWLSKNNQTQGELNPWYFRSRVQHQNLWAIISSSIKKSSEAYTSYTPSHVDELEARRS